MIPIRKLIYVSTPTTEIDQNGDFAVPLTKTINRFKTIQLISYNIPFSWPNVTAFTNTITYIESGVTHVATITPGNYSLYEFMSAVSVAMTAASGEGQNIYKMTSSGITTKFTLVASGRGFPFTIVGATTTAAKLLGMNSEHKDESSTATLPSGQSLTFGDQFDLLPIKELQIHLPGIVRNVDLALTKDINSLIQVISLSGYHYGEYMREESSAIISDANVNSLGRLVVSVTDQDGWMPTFAEAQPLSMVFEVTYMANVNEY